MPNNTLLSCHVNEKSVLLTNTKVASSVCDKLYNNHAYNLSISLDKGFKIDNISRKHDYDIKHKKIKHDYESIEKDILSILEGKSKKDLILLYRNPIERFYAGFHQEFMRALENTESLYFWVKQFENGEALFEYISNNRDRDGKSYNWKKEPIPNIFRESIVTLAKDFWTLKRNHQSLFTAHTTNYLYFYLILLSFPKLNSTKVKLIDISKEDILPHVTKYTGKVDENLFPPSMKDTELRSIVQSSSDRVIGNSRAIEDLLLSEMNCYYFLQSLPYNLEEINEKITT